MEWILLTIVIFLLFSYFKKKDTHQEEVELTVKLDIKSPADLKKAEEQLKNLYGYEHKTSGESYEILTDAISQLETAIADYKYEFQQEQYEDEINNYKSYPLEEVKIALYYKKADGKETNRIVEVVSYSKEYIYGYCHLRNEYRTFRTDRIKEIADGETGEIIKDINSFFVKKYESSSYYKMDCLFEKYKAVFRVLFYIAKADGIYLKAEKIIVRDAIRKLTNDETLEDEVIDNMMNSLAVPTFSVFKTDIKKINNEKYPIDIFKVALDIVNTQNEVHSKEKQAIEFLAENLDYVSSDDIIYKADLLKKIKEQKEIEKLEKKKLQDKKLIEAKKECPYCHSKNTLKKGLRQAKDHTNQRFQCNNCNKIFSEKIENF